MLGEMFVRHAVAFRPDVAPMVACFFAVRDVPYAIDGAHDADGLLHTAAVTAWRSLSC